MSFGNALIIAFSIGSLRIPARGRDGFLRSNPARRCVVRLCVFANDVLEPALWCQSLVDAMWYWSRACSGTDNFGDTFPLFWLLMRRGSPPPFWSIHCTSRRNTFWLANRQCADAKVQVRRC